ncbi:MAG: tRNA (5-methylaminomethyl-2-thiouridine)(34)-methyltransferase MnmD [Bacteriovoracaceae bacterium]
MINPPKNYDWLATEDGSYSLFSKAFEEGCHSTSGAKLETITHYIKGCDVLEKAKAETLSILEVGWGLGLGYQTTIEELKKHQLTPNLHFLSLEIDPELIHWVRDQLSFETAGYPAFSQLQKIELNDLTYYEAKSELGTLTILCGDARVTLPRFQKLFPEFKAQVIYQDAFSPKKNPTLWTVEWFLDLKNISSPDVRLSTYSASNSIRKSMIEAGWNLFKGERFGKKKTSTRAKLVGTTDSDILELLARSPITSLRDGVEHV